MVERKGGVCLKELYSLEVLRLHVLGRTSILSLATSCGQLMDGYYLEIRELCDQWGIAGFRTVEPYWKLKGRSGMR